MPEPTVSRAMRALRRLTGAYRSGSVSQDDAIGQARRLRRVILMSSSPTWRKAKAKARNRAANRVARHSRRVNRLRAS